jgi:hypothetical protein
MTSTPNQAQQDVYRSAFVHNCLALLVHARLQLAGTPLASEEEPAITGLLVQRAKEIIESDDAAQWMEQLEVLDDPPQNDRPDRRGKRRPRIDIEFVEVHRGPRPRFHIEAKRLYRSDSVGEYVGTGGLGMFLDGAYASAWPSAGMLGYVQNRNCAEWLGEVGDRLANGMDKFRLCQHEPTFSSPDWPTAGLENVKTSCHTRTDEHLGSLRLFHVLLDCC